MSSGIGHCNGNARCNQALNSLLRSGTFPLCVVAIALKIVSLLLASPAVSYCAPSLPSSDADTMGFHFMQPRGFYLGGSNFAFQYAKEVFTFVRTTHAIRLTVVASETKRMIRINHVQRPIADTPSFTPIIYFSVSSATASAYFWLGITMSLTSARLTKTLNCKALPLLDTIP